MNAIPKILLAGTFALLAACNTGPTEEEKRAALAQRAEQDAALQLRHFQEAQAAGRDRLALNFADYIQNNYPQTQAAATVKPLAAALRTKLDAAAEETRLRDMWAYHSADDKQAGGVVRTAYVYSKNDIGPAVDGKAAPKARLVLRRHPQWGDDVYVLSDRGNFTCGSPCTVSVRFDDGPATTYPASIPATGEPAIFVEDFKRFMTALPAAKLVRIDVVLKDGGAQTPEFEVDGYSTATLGAP